MKFRAPIALCLVFGTLLVCVQVIGQTDPNVEAITREVSLYNLGESPTAVEASTRELSIYNYGADAQGDDPEGPPQGISREVSLFNFGDEPHGDCLPAPSGLAGWWRGDGNGIDSIGSSDGALQNGVLFAPGIEGQAFSLDGTDDYIEIPNSPALNPENQITLEAWYKGTVSFVGNGNNAILDKGYSSHSDPYYQYHLGVVGDQYIAIRQAAFTFDLSLGGVGRGIATPSGAWRLGEWAHVVGTYDGTAMKLYVNGDLMASLETSGSLENYGRPARIGGFSNLNAFTPGLIDDVRIYSRALTAEEVRANYEMGSVGLCDERQPVEGISREVSLFNFGEPEESIEAISREVSLLFEEKFPPVAAVIAEPSATPAPGTTIVLRATATGTEPFQYQWRYNGENIPGANGATYTIENAQPADSGAYSCLVVNGFGAATTATIDLRVQVPVVFLADRFGDRQIYQQPSFQGSSSNAQAGPNEAGEPKHGNKSGGRSMWMGWRTETRGVVRFSTAGSNFDTVLAVYTGGVVNQLVPVTSDDDSGGYFTSALEFAAEPGVEYQVAVDGFAESAGRIVLGWAFEPSAEEFPLITTQPQSAIVAEGASATLRVIATGSANLTYQWFFNGEAMPGRVENILTLNSISDANVGTYRVRVNAGNNFVWSELAHIEISSALDASPSKDKVQELFDTGAGAGRQAAGGAFPIVAAGVFGYQLINNFGASISQGDPNFANAITTGSRWAGVTAQSSGLILLDTVGSEIDTVLAVYPADANLLTAQPIAADDNGAADGIRSKLVFNATGGVSYMVVAAGVKGQQGKIKINWLLGTAPSITTPLQNVSAQLGGSAAFSVVATGTPSPSYRWIFRRGIIPLQNGSTLELNNLEETDFGLYRVEMENSFGKVSSQANLELRQVFQFTSQPRVVNNLLELDISGGTAGKMVVFEFSDDLRSWAPVLTNAGAANFKVELPMPGPFGFFRAQERE